MKWGEGPFCALQTDRLMKRLAEDAAFKKEYFALWRQQRKYPLFQFEEEQKKLAEVSLHSHPFLLPAMALFSVKIRFSSL